MSKKNNMNFVAKMLTDRDQYANSMSFAKILDTCKCTKAQKIEMGTFAEDVKAMHTLAFEIFKARMEYAHGNINAVKSMNEYHDDENARNALYDAIATVFDDIGIIGEGKLIGNYVVYEYAVNNCFKYVDEYHGKALTVKSQLTNEKKTLAEYKKSPNGINAEAIIATEDKIDRLTNELAELKKQYGMVSIRMVQSNANSFVSVIEKLLCMLAKRQLPMTVEEYKAYKKEAKEAQNAKRKNAKK